MHNMDRTPDSSPTDVDVLIVGAGISGIGTAFHLKSKQPGVSFAVLEARQAIGGTWDLFRYPGIRSDSELNTFGFAFKPWTEEETIADGDLILNYLQETIDENGLESNIRLGHKVLRAEWNSGLAQWKVTIELTDSGEQTEMTCRWLFAAGGYYDYEKGFTPDFAGADRFDGELIHPQHWPADFDGTGKRIVIIGSGATAVTLVPALARQAGHVTMLQRSPSYVVSVPSVDRFAIRARRLLGDKRGYTLSRHLNIWRQIAIYGLSKRFPRTMRKLFMWGIRKQLPAGFDVDTHFNPTYDPWDQRLCVVPDGDLFEAISDGKASVVTDRIRNFTENGIRLESGREIEADVIVTATGLNLRPFGSAEVLVDGRKVELPETVVYKGTMLSGVPNFSFSIGYTNASWTLKVDLVAEYLCRMLDYMRQRGFTSVVPETTTDFETRPLLDFDAGYVKRVAGSLPRQGPDRPWTMNQNYHRDVKALIKEPVADPALKFESAAHRAGHLDHGLRQVPA